FLLGDGAGGGEGGKEHQQPELHQGEHVEQEQAEAGVVTKRGGAAPADHALPGGKPQNPQKAVVSGAEHVMAGPPRHGQPLAVEDGAQQGSQLPRPPPRRFAPRRRVLLMESERKKEGQHAVLIYVSCRRKVPPWARRRSPSPGHCFFIGKSAKTEGQGTEVGKVGAYTQIVTSFDFFHGPSHMTDPLPRRPSRLSQMITCLCRHAAAYISRINTNHSRANSSSSCRSSGVSRPGKSSRSAADQRAGSPPPR